MDNYHVVAEGSGWKLHLQGDSRALLNAPTKAQLLEQLPGYMEGRTGSVKIHTATGQIEDERTYPRSADPRRSKG
ncbi:DUF2188 domain-containing protein [Pseudomonas aeruginosa]|mgnify:FL=1|jgi:hypothetical protein|uniref:DUF2188 domain-containing protein n=3 Tax=Pseudomonas TaxID=286 RepID=A0A3M4KAI4_9PSED|nr:MULTISPECIES: DUF2188 domain-containing protein [Pseudomonas]MCT8191226.1 DUF2188 domain-containing protein [Pseudomonas monteilii]QNV69388.1 DUF2188 domain-containing protein [Pseudomonas sp. CFA]AGZ38096.1 hypothetical protein PVLB_26797 [Pseudomonas sp. VLB120]MCF3157329.1 DUF2188 domain-containing protein [Pseudomonas juntendi]MDH0760441.1 DUF2188 domain-containing protein [Pseudomonas juntendi]